jgi:hypothetical protein
MCGAPHSLSTCQAGEAVSRAARGGLLSGTGVQAVASLLVGAARIQRSLRVAAREAEATGFTGLTPITVAFKACAEVGGTSACGLNCFTACTQAVALV